jgi:hypothetical protein
MKIKKEELNILVKDHQINSSALISIFNFIFLCFFWFLLITPSTFLIVSTFNISNVIGLSLFSFISAVFIIFQLYNLKEEIKTIKQMYLNIKNKLFFYFIKTYFRYLLFYSLFHNIEKYKFSKKILLKLIENISLKDIHELLVIKEGSDINLMLFSLYLSKNKNKFTIEELNFINDNQIDISKTFNFNSCLYIDFVGNIIELKNKLISKKINEFL